MKFRLWTMFALVAISCLVLAYVKHTLVVRAIEARELELKAKANAITLIRTASRSFTPRGCDLMMEKGCYGKVLVPWSGSRCRF